MSRRASSTLEARSPTAEQPVPRSRWPWLVQVLLCPVLLFAAIYSQLAFLLVPGMERLDQPSTPGLSALAAVVTVAMGLTTLLVALGGVALLARLDGRRRLRDVGWRVDRRSLPLLGLGVLVSAVVLVAADAPASAADLLRYEDSGIGDAPVWKVLVAGLTAAFLLQAIPEELIFRGYLLGSLRMRPVPAVLVSAVSFAVIHLASSGGQQGWGEQIAYLAMPLGFGLAAGALSLLTRSLWIAVGIHGGLHVTVLASVLLERVDPAFAGGNGPALWLFSGLGWTVVAAVAMWLLARRGRGVAADGAR